MQLRAKARNLTSSLDLPVRGDQIGPFCLLTRKKIGRAGHASFSALKGQNRDLHRATGGAYFSLIEEIDLLCQVWFLIFRAILGQVLVFFENSQFGIVILSEKGGRVMAQIGPQGINLAIFWVFTHFE